MTRRLISEPCALYLALALTLSLQVHGGEPVHAAAPAHQPTGRLQRPVRLVRGQLGGPPDLRHLQRRPELPVLHHPVRGGTLHRGRVSDGEPDPPPPTPPPPVPDPIPTPTPARSPGGRLAFGYAVKNTGGGKNKKRDETKKKTKGWFNPPWRKTRGILGNDGLW